jgi:flagellum-specific peptidoglycan hydrolase FlgJ
VKFVRALHAAGYATDPRYADKLEALMHSAPIRQAAAAAA